ncbi:hypothetical protein [Paenibacillus sp. 1P07SE]|uniref:hypothetical protein n=1 Tax=Paenibacillus sp. 1P07SE TaxID=3132209 RepID=UPI0039A72407
MDQFEQAYEQFLQQQKLNATGARRERLEKIGPGEKRLLQIIWRVFKSFEGFHLEYEILSINNVRIFIDIFYEPLGIAFECEGYVVHAEIISRDRFTFERMRIRSMVLKGYIYLPFTYDELEKNTEVCQRFLYTMLGKLGSNAPAAFMALSVQERELLRHMSRMNRKISNRDVAECLKYSAKGSRDVLRAMLDKQLILPVGSGTRRHHYYELTDQARELLQTTR